MAMRELVMPHDELLDVVSCDIVADEVSDFNTIGFATLLTMLSKRSWSDLVSADGPTVQAGLRKTPLDL